MSVTIRLPFPPSVNHYWGQRVIVPKGRVSAGRPFVHVFVGERGKEFREHVRQCIASRFGADLGATTKRIEISVLMVAPDRRTRDLDNILKATKDALTYAGVWEDDSQVDRLEVVRGKVQAPGWLEVTIRPIEHAEPVVNSLF